MDRSFNTNTQAGDYLVLLLLILAGTAMAVWFLTLPLLERQAVIDKALTLSTFLAAQPGVYLSARALMRRQTPWVQRISTSLAIFLLLSIIFPACLAAWWHGVFRVF